MQGERHPGCESLGAARINQQGHNIMVVAMSTQKLAVSMTVVRNLPRKNCQSMAVLERQARPRGFIYTTTMELGPQTTTRCLLGSNSVVVVHMDPQGIRSTT